MENVHLEVDTSKFKNYKGVLRFIFSDDLAKILTSIAIKHKTYNIY